MRPQAASRPLVGFILRHAQVRTNLCTRQKHETGYALAPRTVSDYNLIYVTRGRPVWTIDGHAHALAPGLLVIVPPGAPHHATCRTRRVTLGSLHVEATLPGGQDVFDLLRPAAVHRFKPGTPLDRYLRGALAEWDRPDERDALLMLATWARLVVLELLRQAAATDRLNPRTVDPVVAAVLEHVTEHVAAPLRLQDVADLAGYTPQHVNRLFRRVLGVTPLQYHGRLRMERAAQLLRDGRLTVQGVAERVGIDDPYYFSRLFKRRFGRGPAEYRAAATEGGSESPSPVSADPWPRSGRRR